MANRLLNRVKMNVSGTPGTGSATLGTTVPGWQSLTAAGGVNGDVIPGGFDDGANWEIGTYTYNAGVLARTSVAASSNANAAISLTSAATFTAFPLVADLATASASRQIFTATAGQTSFTVAGGYDAGFIDVFQNGVKLVNATDVTVSSGTAVVLAAAASVGDTIEVVAYRVFQLTNAVNRTGDTMTGTLGVPSLQIGTDYVSPYGFRNRVINGAMMIDQRFGGAAISVPGNTFYYTVDRWIVASSNAIGAQQGGGGTNQTWLNVTGAAGNTAANARHRIEAKNSGDLAGLPVTISFTCNATPNRTVTLALNYASGATADDFATTTQVGTAAFSATGTGTRFQATFTLPSGATKGLEILLDFGALLASQGVNIWNVQLEQGSVATPFERRPYGVELELCQRYYQPFTIGWWGEALVGSLYGTMTCFPVPMRASPSASFVADWDVVNFPTTAPTMDLITANKMRAYKTASSSAAGRWFASINLTAEL